LGWCLVVEEASEAITKKKAQCSTGRRERAPDTTSPTTPVDKFFRSDPATRPQVTLMPYARTPEARRWLQNTSGFKEVDEDADPPAVSDQMRCAEAGSRVPGVGVDLFCWAARVCGQDGSCGCGGVCWAARVWVSA
jgi:hypothetical protein